MTELNSKYLEEIVERDYTIRLLPYGVVENYIHDYVTVDKERMLSLRDLNARISDHRPYGLLFTSGLLTSITREAMEVTTETSFSSLTQARAILVSTLGHRLIASFYLKLKRPNIATKVFANRDEALTWLRLQLQRN